MNAPSRRRRILVIDDEPQMRRALREILTTRDFDVQEVGSAAEALDALLSGTPDLIVLDLSLPDMDGLDLCERIRTWLFVPILVLSVRADESDKIQALNRGTDDYLTKPFSAGELVARVNALLRRSVGAPAQAPLFEIDELVVDMSAHEVTVAGRPVSLTPIEFDILATLVQNPDRLVTWSQVARSVWGDDTLVDTRTIRVHVSNLRHKVEPHPTVPRYILTEPGVGLKFNTR